MSITYLTDCAIGGIIVAVGDSAAGTRLIAVAATNGMEIVGTAFRAVEETVSNVDNMTTIAPTDEAACVVARACDLTIVNTAFEINRGGLHMAHDASIMCTS